LRALGPLTLELIAGDGGESQAFSLDREAAKGLLDKAKEAAAKFGMSWPEEPLTLIPAPKLVGLIRKSRQLTVVEEQPA
jgi:CRISPR-associated protein Csb1